MKTGARAQWSLFLLVGFVEFSAGLSFGFPSITSWGWGEEAVNYTKVITSPETLKRYALSFPFQQCSSGMEGVMTRVIVSPCAIEDGRCYLTHGDNVTLDLEFVSNIPTGSLVGSMFGIFSSWLHPVSFNDAEDLCKSEFITCPAIPLVPYRYKTSIFIRPTFLRVSPDVKVLIKGDDKREIACAIVPISIRGRERDNFQSSQF